MCRTIEARFSGSDAIATKVQPRAAIVLQQAGMQTASL
jgi:hypothetical protein